jgi:tight adherence protein C
MIAAALLIPVLGALCVFLFALSLIPSKSPLSQTIEALEANQSSGKNDGNSNLERVLDEVLPRARTGKLTRTLLQAGWYNVTASQMILRMVAGACAGLAIAMLVGPMLGSSQLFVIVAETVICAAAAYAPMTILQRAAEARKAEVQRTLPDFLDMVASTIQAGLAMNAALAYAVDAAPGALGDEIKEALSEVRLGRAKADALKAAAYRLNQQEFSTTISAITQAERLGANIAKVLSELAEDTRTHRIMLVEEQAAKLPVKMVLPMAFFLLPALFIMIFGTLAANYFAKN